MRATIAAVLLAVAGCDPTPEMHTVQRYAGGNPEAPEIGGRFTITRVGVFRDKLAYDGERGVYLIRDSETEREFVGISGVGISELGSHGKQVNGTRKHIEDER